MKYTEPSHSLGGAQRSESAVSSALNRLTFSHSELAELLNILENRLELVLSPADSRVANATSIPQDNSSPLVTTLNNAAEYMEGRTNQIRRILEGLQL